MSEEKTTTYEEKSKSLILQNLIKCSSATRKLFLNKPDKETNKCYQSDKTIVNQMLGIISIPIHYVFDIRVKPASVIDISTQQMVDVKSFLSFELHLVPSLNDKNYWVEVPDKYNVVDFVFRCLLQTHKNVDIKTSYESLISHAKIIYNTDSDKTKYNSELISNPSDLREEIREGKKGMKVSFITFHYKSKTYIAQLLIHIFPNESSSSNNTETATQYKTSEQTPESLHRPQSAIPSSRKNYTPTTPRSNSTRPQIPRLPLETITNNTNSKTNTQNSPRKQGWT